MSQKLITSLNKKKFYRDYDFEDWNQSVKEYFGPFFKRKSVVIQNLEALRTELVSLAKILSHPNNPEILKELLKITRSVIRVDPKGTFDFILFLFTDTVSADLKWMNMHQTFEPLPPKASMHDKVFQDFNTLGNILEGCYIPRLRLIYGIFKRKYDGRFPEKSKRLDFGGIVSGFPMGGNLKVEKFLRDPIYSIPINQWRNIACHQSFKLVSSRSLEIEYGPTKRYKVKITSSNLRKVLLWVVEAYNILMLFSTIIHLEYAKELRSIGFPEITLSLENSMVSIIHNLRIAGFQSNSYEVKGEYLILKLIDIKRRNKKKAIAHASQALCQLCMALENDISKKARVKYGRIELVNKSGRMFSSATVEKKEVMKFLSKKISMKNYIDKIKFVIKA